MKRLILLPALFLTFSLTKAFACSCEYQGSFLKVADHTSFIALVKVTKYLTFKDINGIKTPMSMKVEVIDRYKGEENRKTITVWGDPGNLCRPYLSEFIVGQYYTIAFLPAGQYPYEKSSDYSISICGAYWLHVDIKRSTATGDINSKDRTIKTINLSELRSEFIKNGY